jgi:hypothetical protein
MGKRNVLSRKNLPTRLPLLLSIVLWLVMDRLNSPQWLYGALGAVMLLVWIAAIHQFFTEKETVLL